MVGISDGTKVDGAGVDVSRGSVAVGVVVAIAGVTGTPTVDAEDGNAAVAVGVYILVLMTEEDGKSAVTVGVVASAPFVVSLSTVTPMVAATAELASEVNDADVSPTLGVGVASPVTSPAVEMSDCVGQTLA